MNRADRVKIAGRLLTRATSLFFDTWLVMVLCGMIHSTWHAFPAFGYWGCMFGVFVLYSVIGTTLLPIGFRLEDK